MQKSLLFLAGLLAAVTAMPASTADAPPSLPFPDIKSIMAVPETSFESFSEGGLVRGGAGLNSSDSPSTIAKRWECSTKATLTWGDQDNGGKGVTITNADNGWRGFYIYHNSCDSVPYKYIWIDAGKTQFVSLPHMFQGRITRGVDSSMLSGRPQLLATWMELTWDEFGVGWADVSLIRGCDGAVLTWALDNGNAWKGFTQWILDGAPNGAYDKKNNGQWVLKYTANADGSVNTIPRDWYMQKVGAQHVYVDDYHGNPVISSRSGRFGTYWPAGRP